MYQEFKEKGVYTFVTSPGNVVSNISTSQASTILVFIALYIVRCFNFINSICLDALL